MKIKTAALTIVVWMMSLTMYFERGPNALEYLIMAVIFYSSNWDNE